MKRKVVVVGAGFAGISASIQLQETHDVVLLEASSEVGGRVKTHQNTDGQLFEMGATYLGKSQPLVWKLIHDLNMEDSLVDIVPLYGEDPRAPVYLNTRNAEQPVKDCFCGIPSLSKFSNNEVGWAEVVTTVACLLILTILTESMEDTSPHKSTGAEILDKYSLRDFANWIPGPIWFQDLVDSGFEFVYSQHTNKTSLLYNLWYLKTNGGFSVMFNDQGGGPQQYVVRDGFQSVAKKYCESKFVKGELRLNSKVAEIRDEGDFMHVVLQDGYLIDCDKVILACPPTSISKNIAFKPQLTPGRNLCLNQIGGYAVKGVVHFSKPWWHSFALLNGEISHIFAMMNCNGGQFTKSHVHWILEASVPANNQHSLAVFFKHSILDILPKGVDINARECQAIMLKEFAEFCRDDRVIDTCIGMHWKDWRQDELAACGPVTNVRVGDMIQVSKSMTTTEYGGKLLFCGSDYSTHFTGYVEGAIASGINTGRQVRGEKPQNFSPYSFPVRGILFVWHRIACFLAFFIIQSFHTSMEKRKHKYS